MTRKKAETFDASRRRLLGAAALSAVLTAPMVRAASLQ
jgi:hypothetical protein